MGLSLFGEIGVVFGVCRLTVAGIAGFLGYMHYGAVPLLQQAAAAASKEILLIRVEPCHHLCIILFVLLVMRWTASVGTQCDMYMSACKMTLVEQRMNAELLSFTFTQMFPGKFCLRPV
jgi:hypothetical protein